MKIGTSCSGRIKREPHLYRNGRGVRGWKGTKEELRKRNEFKRLDPGKQAKIEAELLASLRETMDSI